MPAESNLPRELQLIIDDIVEQNVHLLEWEVFGNTTEDMRVVLTWRHIEFAKNSRWNQKHIGKSFGDEDEDSDEGIDALENEWMMKNDPDIIEDEGELLIIQKPEVMKKMTSVASEDREETVPQIELSYDVHAANIKLEEVEHVLFGDEEIDLNAKRDIAPEKAKRMVAWQRKKFSVSIEIADLDEKELTRRFPDGVNATLYGEGWDKCCDHDHEDEEADDGDAVPGMNMGMTCDPLTGKFLARDGSTIEVDSTISIFIRPDGSRLDIDQDNNMFFGRDGSSYDATTGEFIARDGVRKIIDPSIGMYMSHDGSSMVIDMDNGKFIVYDGRGMSIDPATGRYIGYDGRDVGSNKTNLYGMYAAYDMRGMYPGMFGTYKGAGFSYNPKSMAYGYEYQYGGEIYASKRIRKRKLKPKMWGPGAPVIRVVEPCYNNKGWESCIDCRYNDFCDNPKHKDEYIHMLWEDEKKPIPQELPECNCNVCKGGAVHNGCLYREILRLKSEYLIFDKHNYCYCSECIPFKYRKVCLRQELRMLRMEGSNHYYRLTTHEGDDGVVRNDKPYESDSDGYGSDEETSKTYGYIQAIDLDDILIEITRQDKIDFRDCPDCQCNGFCDNIRHKKLYQMLLRIDDEDFGILQDECYCLVCEFKGAAHSGCVERELRRLKYDLMLFDIRNLCYCRECVPFKYRKICLRQELKQKRRQRGINLYNHV